jgi:hypothetical protein
VGTQKIQVANTTFLVDRLGMDCGPLQYVRELTQNSLEAIQKRRESGWDGPGQVIWDVDWHLVKETGNYKLQIADNGVGMSGPDMERYINSLSSSGSEQGLSQNFGVGAKIAAGRENPHGLIYRSWVDGKGVLVQFWRDPKDGYGLRQIQLGEDYAHYAPISNKLRTPPIDTHGTCVTLSGSSADENTYAKHGLKQKWLIEYLNSRYFALPENVAIKVRDFTRANPDEWPRSPEVAMGAGGSQMRTVRGMRSLLEENSVSRGTVELETARAHWFILPENLNVAGGVWNDKAHLAALFQNELYDVRSTRQTISELRDYGVLYGQQRVVLYLEPRTDKLEVVANTARSSLLVADEGSGKALPWEDWKEEFRSKLPTAIRDMMNDILAKAGTGDYNEEVRRRLKEIRDLFSFARYRRTKNGSSNVTGTLPGGSERDFEGERGGAPGRSGGTGGGAGELFGSYIEHDGDPAEKAAQRDNYPRTEWVSVNEGTRVADDDLEDRAARYVKADNLIQINADFRAFERMLSVLATEYPHADTRAVQKTFREWTALQLAEAVYAVLQLQGSPEWDTHTVYDSALSPAALTTAVMSRYTLLTQMRRQLAGQVGKTPAAQSLSRKEVSHESPDEAK